MKSAELDAILGTARLAAQEAAALAKRGFRKNPVVEHKGAVDLVTSFDRESEELLRDRLGKAFGSFDIVGEEQGGAFRKEVPTLFIDPIDGTTNFVHGHPFWCVSVGLLVEGEPVLGIVIAPSLGLEWSGWVAEDGARKALRGGPESPDGNEESCVVSPMAKFEDSLLATGFPYDRRTSDDNNFEAFVAIKRRCQAVRRCGSAALDLCLVADGTYEGYWERKLRPWDLAGGAALVRAAGGRISDFDGGDGSVVSGHMVATNGLIHDVLLAELASLTPASKRR